MAHNKFAVIFMLTVGCGGESFSSGFNPSPGLETDGGYNAAGGAAAVETDGGNSTGGSSDGAGGKIEHAHGGSGTGGAREGSGGASTGGVLSSAGGQGSGGASAGGAGSGGAGSGGMGAGGSGSGGAPQEMDAGCTHITHDNGLGQSWQDCVPLGTYNEAQAAKACEASGAPKCSPAGSSASSPSMVCGYNTSGGYSGGCWGYADASTGHVVAADAAGSVPITTGSWR